MADNSLTLKHVRRSAKPLFMMATSAMAPGGLFLAMMIFGLVDVSAQPGTYHTGHPGRGKFDPNHVNDGPKPGPKAPTDAWQQDGTPPDGKATDTAQSGKYSPHTGRGKVDSNHGNGGAKSGPKAPTDAWQQDGSPPDGKATDTAQSGKYAPHTGRGKVDSNHDNGGPKSGSKVPTDAWQQNPGPTGGPSTGVVGRSSNGRLGAVHPSDLSTAGSKRPLLQGSTNPSAFSAFGRSNGASGSVPPNARVR